MKLYTSRSSIRTNIIYTYNILLLRVVENSDLAVTFDATLCFNKYYLNIYKKIIYFRLDYYVMYL